MPVNPMIAGIVLLSGASVLPVAESPSASTVNDLACPTTLAATAEAPASDGTTTLPAPSGDLALGVTRAVDSWSTVMNDLYERPEYRVAVAAIRRLVREVVVGRRVPFTSPTTTVGESVGDLVMEWSVPSYFVELSVKKTGSLSFLAIDRRERSMAQGNSEEALMEHLLPVLRGYQA